MKIPFTKMHGAGNDFIMIDDRALTFPIDDCVFMAGIAARRTGIGCDGIILLQPSECADLRMRFINPDGREVDMCGNGARCLARYARRLGAASDRMIIETLAGPVHAEMAGDGVRLELTDPRELQLDLAIEVPWATDYVNTGVPHVAAWVVDDVDAVDVASWGRAIRHHARFSPKGTNANFARIEPDGSITVRTYERGVEAETLACGTGAAAVAVLAARRGWISLPVSVHCAGGYDLVIDSSRGKTTLTGNAETVFEGEMDYYGNRV